MTRAEYLAKLKASVRIDPAFPIAEDAGVPEYFVEERIDRVLTQYRESYKLLSLCRTYLEQVAELEDLAYRLIDYFDVDTAVGDQLTILGKALGWPRCHCRGQRRPVFGFACEDGECGPPVIPVAGFCEAEWDCGGPDYVEFCFTDDEMYRRFLKARIVTLLGDYTRAGLTVASRELFGPLAVIYREDIGEVSVATSRFLSTVEISIAHLFAQVLPVAPGVRFRVWHSRGVPFGFGEGWGGFCDGYFPVEIPYY
ncbi:DUF2612 domain-containing protein [Aurantimonas coralicida]|uniref:DUF2612 domain-containing protein n=1 Tax=Aurantimonas coralicida TaxID=182270 RepID=UPI001E299324|nr:DUF2612 domain-containing protein [Aurantimonas coralicida]MCD1645237.1 DUF2612 domain-containing protein [Aurantimonas coralicida]